MRMIVTAAVTGAGILVFPSASAATAVSAPQKACTFTWFNIDDRDVLTAVSEAKTLAKGETWVPSMQVLRSGVAQVTGVKLDQPQAAITSLGEQIRRPLAPIGGTYPSRGRHGENSFGGAGRYVVYQMVSRLVDADFVVECGGKRLGAGHATSWQPGDAGGTAQCGVKTGDKTRIADLALRLAC
ncbi:hypothetical protein [Nonomuraea pusilla]|uniref:Hydrophobic W protein n=1 Tax=Nonomuraea pusilla TaxID=46177 RepID=A0A1H7X911_9ACTN|nr:hypothetical protein [Nonomuraea pusilla]SEM30191.1 hypothetical protein SAMN05660976_04798 [Nonomuraea pusilla]